MGRVCNELNKWVSLANDQSCTTESDVKGNYPSVSLVSVVIVHQLE